METSTNLHTPVTDDMADPAGVGPCEPVNAFPYGPSLPKNPLCLCCQLLDQTPCLVLQKGLGDGDPMRNGVAQR